MEKVWKLLLRPVQDVLREESSSRTKLPNHDAGWRAQHTPHLLELARHQASEDSVYIAGRVKVSSLAELPRAARVVAELSIVETQLHISGEGNRAMFPDLSLD